MKKIKIFILIIVISVTLLAALDIQTKGKITSLIGSVNLMNLKSSDVSYTNNSQNTLDGALDTLYTKIAQKQTYEDMICPGCVYRKSTTKKYNTNSINSSEENSKLTSSEYTTNYKTLNSNYFLGHVIDGDGYILSSYVCGINNGKFFCLKSPDKDQSSLEYKPFYNESINILNNIFSTCEYQSSQPRYFCNGEIKSSSYEVGSVQVYGTTEMCEVYKGISKCSAINN